MNLHQIVEINERGTVASSVNFAMMDNQQMNLSLCEGFIFNYDFKRPEISTVGILDVIRRSYHSPNESNIHLMIQDYGKGKSHFAVAIANFFKHDVNSSEVKGILHQIEMATKNKNTSILESLKLYKQNQRHNHLVICLSGDKGGDIKKQFLQVVIKSLEEQGITDTLAQSTCKAALDYLENLDSRDKVKAEEYLRRNNNADGDLNNIISLLRDNNPSIIPVVKNIVYHVSRVTPDFSADIDIEEILRDLVINYCTGANARFQGILILFDELNYYLQSWSADPIAAGGTSLQNITNICENHKGKIALFSFAQFHPARKIGISANAIQSYEKISTRLSPKNSTYDNPVSSLELVLDNLLIQKEGNSNWDNFNLRWQNTLISESRIAFEQRITTYKEKGWTLEEFHRHLGKGCFPLHPITAYLLCNLDFTQDRTAIEFIKGYVKKFIQDEPIEKAGKLNYIYPIALVDTFTENFANESVYEYYKKAISLVIGSDDDDELDQLIVSKALFLFYACAEKLTKPDREEHEVILEILTGLPKLQIKAALEKLHKKRDIIYYKRETKLYCFWEGISPSNIEEGIEEKIKKINTSIDNVVSHCTPRVKTYLDDDTVVAKQFVQDNKLVGFDWRFEVKIYSINQFIKALSSERTLRETEERGILAYVLAQKPEELQEFRNAVEEHLSQSLIKNQIAVAIPVEGTGDLARLLLKIKTLQEKDTSEKEVLGKAYAETLKRWSEEVDKKLERLFNNCTYHCVELETIPLSQQRKPQQFISVLLKKIYPLVPPVADSDKMRQGHTTGSKVIGFVARQLFADNLSPQTLPPDNAYKTVINSIFVSTWGLLKESAQKYTVQEPKNPIIRNAWDKISQMTDFREQPEKIINLENLWKVLSAPPYGYSEFTFTVLLAAWLSFHRKEISLRGANKISLKKGEFALIQTKSLKDWANSDIDILQKPAAFVHDWILKGKEKAKLIRHRKAEMPLLSVMEVNYDEAQQYLENVVTFLQSSEPEPHELDELNRNRELVSIAKGKIDIWFQPVLEVEEFKGDVGLEKLLQLYPLLTQNPPNNHPGLGVISVNPTHNQCDRQTVALKIVNDKITEIIQQKSRLVDSLSTSEACNACKVEIQEIIHQITPVQNLPPNLIEILRDAIRTTDLKLREIAEQTQIQNCFQKIQNLNKNLNDDSTQQDFATIRNQIENLARNIPNTSPEMVDVNQILENLEQRYQELLQKIEIWEERSSSVTSPNQILELIKEISSQSRRFTEDICQQSIATLQQRLENELPKVRDRDDAEKLVRSELSSAQQKLQRIRDLPDNKLAEAFQIYQELINSALPATEQAVSLEQYQKNLDGYKTHGHTTICEKFSRLYNSKLNRLEDYEALREQLQKYENMLVDVEDFLDIRNSIHQSLENLELQQQELQRQLEEKQKQAEDKRIIQQIRIHQSTAKLKTVNLCEEAITEINTLKNSLSNPNSFAAEIEQIIKRITDKLAGYEQSLAAIGNQIAKVDNLATLSKISTEFAKLDFVFQASTDYTSYQELLQEINNLNHDLEQIQNIENICQQCNDINRCHETLARINEMIDNGEIILQDRFREKISELQENLHQKIQGYISELREIENNLEDVNKFKDAQRIQENLLQKSLCYINSDLQENYESVKSEVNLLIEFLQIIESVKAYTLETCELQLEKIQEWQNHTINITDNLRTRIESFHQEIEQKKAVIIQQKQTAAQNWLKELGNQCAQMYRLTDDTAEKLEAANNILQRIQSEKFQHIEFLADVHQNSLKYIESQCIDEQGKHQANQILILFRQLPRLQRQEVYESLAKYLSEETGDVNDSI